jgi:subtilisin family serine protease
MLLALICACLLPDTVYAKPERFAEGRIIVLPRAGLPEADLKKIVGKARKIGQSDLYIVDIPHGSERGMVARLEHNPHFKFAELDYIVSPDFIPDDPNYINAWHHPNIGSDKAWDTAQGAGVTIAILDSGVEAHPDLVSRLVPGWNFYDSNSNTADVFGHGTKVAGAAAAITNNALGVSGVAGQARIMPIRVAAPTGSAPISAIASGITYAADKGVRIANASFESIAGSASIQNASYYMKSKGGLVTVAAGNGGAALPYAESSALIAVSATDSNNNKASWSSYGPYVDVAAPGVSIATTAMGNTYAWVHGTSFASPVTAGVIALMMSVNPGASNLEIEKVLCSTALDVGSMGRDSYYGCGRIDAAAAVLAVKAATDFDIEAPLISITSPGNDDSVSGLVPVNVSASDNRGVARVELRVNGSVVAIDTASPFAFTWDSAGTVNGIASLVAIAYDAAGNVAASDPVQVNVANVIAPAPVRDTTPPVVKIINPVAGSVSGKVTITVNSSDNAGPSGISNRIYVDGALKTFGTGGVTSYSWNSRSVSPGQHVIKATATDKAGNVSTATVSVTVVK